MFVRVLPLLVAAVLSAVPASVHAAIRARLLGSGFDRPVALVFDPVVPGAAYLVQQTGLVRAFLNGAERPTPFLDLRTVISGGTDERGLLGMAFPPDAAATGHVFVNFTNANGHTVIARFTRSADPLVANPASRFDLKFPAAGGGRQGFITQPYSNHNGGNLQFGADGYLYIGMGDGGSGDDPDNNAQTGTTLLGKMLRLDVAGEPLPNGYTIPPSNPSFPVTALPEIWAFGLRNPWRYSFDNVGAGATGALVIGDVGQGAREEIDYEPAGQGGRNYGWRYFEGTIDNPVMPIGAPAYFPVQAPISDYGRNVGATITGGYVYRGTALGAAYRGRYFYADCAVGRIWSLQLTIDPFNGEATASDRQDHTSELNGSTFNCISSFGRDGAGELYFVDFNYNGTNTGRVFKIEPATATVPNVPTNLGANVQGNAVTLSWNAPSGGDAPTGYVMEAGSAPGAANIGVVPTSSTSLFFAGVPDGRYYVRVRASNAAGVGSATSDLVVNVGCSGPPATPTGFTTSVAGSVVTVGWSVPSGATSIVFEAGYTPGTTIYSQSFAAPTAGFAIPAPPGTYYTRVRAVNACGASGASNERTVVVPYTTGTPDLSGIPHAVSVHEFMAPHTARAAPLLAAMSNSFGFGGTNASLAFTRVAA